MSVYLLDDTVSFPHPSLAQSDGLLAVGGDLRPERLVLAYSNGIFPWYEPDDMLLWWAPDPRYVVFVNDYKATKNLTKIVKQNKFTVKINSNFKEVIKQCAKIPRKDQDGTWLGKDMIKAYTKLHQLGVAISVEVYLENKLVGGLYGIKLERVFCGESMFHLVSDAGSVAFYYLIDFCTRERIELIDAQMHTTNMEKHGGKFISFEAYEKYLYV